METTRGPDVRRLSFTNNCLPGGYLDLRCQNRFRQCTLRRPLEQYQKGCEKGALIGIGHPPGNLLSRNNNKANYEYRCLLPCCRPCPSHCNHTYCNHSEPRPNFPFTLHWLFRPGVKEHCLNTNQKCGERAMGFSAMTRPRGAVDSCIGRSVG